MTDDEALVVGRESFPDLADREQDAYARVRQYIAVGDPRSASKALADWIDARAEMIAIVRMGTDRQ